MIKKSILNLSLVAALVIPTISMAATTPDKTKSHSESCQTFIIKNDIDGASIGTVDNIKEGCYVSQNDGQTIKIMCPSSFSSNQADFHLSKDGKTIGFIVVSNSLLSSATVELKTRLSDNVISSCNGDYFCGTAASSGSMYLLPINKDNTKTIVIKGPSK